MKNIFRFLMAVAVLLTASCAKEDISSSIVGGGEVEMTFTVDLPELGTRANTYGNGANATLLRYYVFDAANGAELEALRGTATRTSGNFTFTLPLLKGMKYNIALWADKNVGTAVAPEGYYDFDGKVVTVDYVNANDNDRDAFYHYEPNFDPTNPRTTTFTLYRPFAQLNAAVSAADMDAVSKNEVALTTSTVKVTTYTEFDIAAGDVVETSKKEVAFTATDMPFKAGEELKADYTYVSMNYLLVPKAGMVSNVTFTLNATKNGGAFAFTGTSYTNVPLKQNFRTNILGALLTAPTNFTVEIEAEFNKPDQIVAADAAAAQEALDNAAPGTVIKLKSGVNYGTLYLRPVAGGAQTKVVDWQGNNYHWETYSCFENITIIGAEGATVDAIKIEGGTYYNTEHSQAATYPVMLSLVELKNVVLDGVTFTGKGGYDPQGYGNAINVSGSNIKVDGLTLKNCVLNNSENNARLLYKTESTTHVHTYTYDGNTFTFTPSLKDITVTDCTFNGGYMGLELRETENITITNNEFNVADRNILLPVNSGCTYTGNVTITGNTSNNAKERFVRMAGAGDAVVVIKDNIISNYLGTDADYIKVTDGTNVTIENNTLANSTTVTVPDSNTQDVVVSTGTTQVTVPAAAAQAGDNYKVVVSNENTATDSVTGQTTVAFDLTLYKNDVKVSGDVVYAVTKNIGTGLFISEVTHNGTALTKATTGADQTYTYDAATGVLTIYTKSFSPFAVTYANYKDYERKLNIAHDKYSTISVSTGGDLLPIVAVNPEIYGYSVYDGDTRITDKVIFRFSDVKKETISENSYKVSFILAVKDANGNDLTIKEGRMNQYIQTDPREYLHVYVNLLEVPAGYSVSEVKVDNSSLVKTTRTDWVNTGEYMLLSNGISFQSKTAGLIEITVTKVN